MNQVEEYKNLVQAIGDKILEDLNKLGFLSVKIKQISKPLFNEDFMLPELGLSVLMMHNGFYHKSEFYIPIDVVKMYCPKDFSVSVVHDFVNMILKHKA